MTRLLLPLALCLLASALSAQVIINEISAANMNGITDGDGDREDWIELYNAGPTTVNLGGWFLSDNPANPQKWVIPSGQTIAPGAYRLVFCSGKDKVAGIYLHTNFKITQT
ncbi:MAG TPA: lamin tail domain-containing protein, partial [Saprospiraceae bacterium]|nr:lamin tail domain-containing protein [Saprospiraceae bacterium]